MTEQTKNRNVAAPMLAAFALTVALAGAGCAHGEAQDIGTVRVMLTQAPSTVRCLRMTVQGTRMLTRSFDLAAGANAPLDLDGLPTGVVSFSGDAFDTGCARVAASASPSWISDVTTVRIMPGAVASVALLMRRNGQADVSVDWAKDLPQPTAYEPFGYASGETALGENGGMGFSGAWTAGGFNAAVNDNFVIGSGSLVYPGLGVSGGHIYSSAQDSISGATRALQQPLGQSGTTRYLSFLIQPEGVLDEGVYSGFSG